jgi:ABC-type phosphate transport system substrate-binding protein
MPIVAGGTSFMYNINIGGKRVTALRLSGDSLAKIFTGVITNWGDAQIKKENPGLALPARKIVPVVRGDGSGTTAQFTTFLASEHQSLWDAYCGAAGRPLPCGTTSIYPVIAGKGFTAQAGSLGVSGYVAQQQNEGTITYVEYSYALNAGFPVVKLLNSAGYYTQPTPQNVAVGLLKATINNDPASPQYLTQNLTGVYRDSDKRTYPLSSYSYMIVPTKIEGTFSAAKGKALGAFAYYFLCEGQNVAPQLGFSPLPINLVQAGLAQIRKIPGVTVENIDIKKCNNPTFSADGSNTLAKTAPLPAPCDAAGPYQCGTTKLPPGSQAAGGNPNGGTGGTGGGSPGTGTGQGTGQGTGAVAGTGATGQGGATGTGGSITDPNALDANGDPIGTGTTSDGAGAGTDVAAVPVVTSASVGVGSTNVLIVLAALILLGSVLIPPLVSRSLRGRTE